MTYHKTDSRRFSLETLIQRGIFKLVNSRKSTSQKADEQRKAREKYPSASQGVVDTVFWDSTRKGTYRKPLKER